MPKTILENNQELGQLLEEYATKIQTLDDKQKKLSYKKNWKKPML